MPYLKISDPIKIGKYIFRDCSDSTDLSSEDGNKLSKISKMFYLKDELRIASFAYTIAPITDLRRRLPDVEYLRKIRNIVGFLYASPVSPFNTPFLSSESASMIVLVPDEVERTIARPDCNVVDEKKDVYDELDRSAGYMVLTEFDSFSFITEATRLYPASHEIFFNYQQNLSVDLRTVLSDPSSSYSLLLKLLDQSGDASILDRYFTSLHWYNVATRHSSDDNFSIVCLSIAFESLLGLPSDDKTSRIADSISMLLGRTERLSEWARQFYDIRSAIVHEGKTENLHFQIPGSKKQDLKYFGSVFSSGLVIYRLCIRTMLFGLVRSEEVNLGDFFISNRERLERIVRNVENGVDDKQKTINACCTLVEQISEKTYVAENGIPYKLVFASLESYLSLFDKPESFEPSFWDMCNRFAESQDQDNVLQRLEALKEMNEFLQRIDDKALDRPKKACKALCHYVWSMAIRMYFYLKRID